MRMCYLFMPLPTVVDDMTVSLGGELAEPADDSTLAGEAPVSSLISRALSATAILGLQFPTPEPALYGGVWEGVSHSSPAPCISVAENYAVMLRSMWGKPLQCPKFNAGFRQVATACHLAEMGLADMPPVEPSIASWTSVRPAHVSPNPCCAWKEYNVRLFNAFQFHPRDDRQVKLHVSHA